MAVYGEEVLGRHCSIKFQVPNATRLKPFPGTIKKYKAELDEDGDVIRKHFVVFEDGDELWLDLEGEQKQRRLKWLNGGVASPTDGGVRPQQPDHAAPSEPPPSNKPIATTPQKKKRKMASRKATPLTPDQAARLESADWIDDMAYWLEHTPHGPSNKTVSSANSKSVMRQVKKLISGQGVSHVNWPSDKVFYQDRPIDLWSTNFDALLLEAKDHEQTYGGEHGWLLTHPIRKLHLFQAYLKEKRGW